MFVNVFVVAVSKNMTKMTLSQGTFTLVHGSGTIDQEFVFLFMISFTILMLLNTLMLNKLKGGIRISTEHQIFIINISVPIFVFALFLFF